MINSSTNRRRGILLQYIQMAFSIIVNLIYTPMMLRILGDAEYGIYNLATSIVSYLSLLSLGFGASYIRFYSKYKSQNDEKGVRSLNGLYMIVFSVIGLIALIAGLFISCNVSVFFNETYTQQNLDTARILMVFLSFNLAVSFPASVFTSYITSHEKYVFQKLLNMGKTILSPCLSIALLLLGYGSIGMVIATTIISLVVDFINAFYCIRKLNMRFLLTHPNFALLKEIFVFSIFIAINSIIDQINWQTDKIIIGKMLNASAVAIYAVGATINSMYLSFSIAISSVFTPQIHRIVNDSSKEEEKKNAELTDLFISVGRIQFLVLGLILTGFVFFGRFFMMEWAGEEYANSYCIALLLMCPATISLCQNIGVEIQRAKNMHQFRSLVYLIMAVLNVGISILFTYWWGYIGTALGTTISLIVGNGLIMNIYYHKKIGINIVKFWKQIIKMLPGFVAPIASGILLKFIHYTKIWQFVVLILMYSVVYAVSVWLLSMNQNEKNIIIKPIKKFFTRSH